MSGTYSTARAPRRLRFRWAFFATRGSNVHDMRITPRPASSARCASFSMRPTPRLRVASRTPRTCDQWTTSPFSTPVSPKRNPTSAPPVVNAPSASPPTYVATWRSDAGTVSLPTRPPAPPSRRAHSPPGGEHPPPPPRPPDRRGPGADAQCRPHGPRPPPRHRRWTTAPRVPHLRPRARPTPRPEPHTRPQRAPPPGTGRLRHRTGARPRTAPHRRTAHHERWARSHVHRRTSRGPRRTHRRRASRHATSRHRAPPPRHQRTTRGGITAPRRCLPLLRARPRVPQPLRRRRRRAPPAHAASRHQAAERPLFATVRQRPARPARDVREGARDDRRRHRTGRPRCGTTRGGDQLAQCRRAPAEHHREAG